MPSYHRDAAWIARTLDRLAGEVRNAFEGSAPPVLVGVRTRGVHLARRLRTRLAEKGMHSDLGELDVTLYRDDIHDGGARKAIRASEIPFDLSGRAVVLVDDVLSTGRTVRAALDELTDFGRPACVRLACLIDRGGRELPIQADFVGERVEIEAGRKLQLRLSEVDELDELRLD